MSHMYPKNFPRENKSSGEKKVFEYFKEFGNPDWYVLHSFRLPKHFKVVFGESDFIIVAPGYGIFTLEIKSGGVGFDGTNWKFIDRDHNVTEKQRGPFEQAREGMFAVESILKSRTHDKYKRSDYTYGYGVIFTDEDNFPSDLLTEDESWRLMQKRPVMDYCDFVKKLEKNFQIELKELGKKHSQAINDAEAEEIVNILRPEIECVAPLKTFVEYSEEDVIKLTDNQFSCLEDICSNDRVVVLGGAGTGKTLLACRDAELANDAGEKVLVLCFNKNLAKYLRKSITPEVDVFHFHSFLFKLSGARYEEDKDVSFFSDILPQNALDCLNNKPVKYSKIIIDEFQDLCTENYLNVIDELLEKGLFDGKFTFYGDFAQQAIFNNGVDLKILSDRTYYTKKHLTINCRNTKNIGNEMVNITGYDDTKYLLQILGEPVDYLSWKDRDEEVARFKEVLKQLKKKGFESSDIVVLSCLSRKESIVGTIDHDKFIIGDIDDDPKSYQALFSTVQAFKGLESKVVILTDIDNYTDSQLMYVGLSRARSKMYVLESDKAAKQRKNNVIRR